MRSAWIVSFAAAITILISSGFCEEASVLSIADLKSFTDVSRQLREEGKLESFFLEEERPLTVGEWTLQVHSLGGSRAFVIVGLMNSERSDHYGDVFADAALSRFAQKKDLDVRSLFVPYRMERPDDGTQSMLVVGTKENVFVTLSARQLRADIQIIVENLDESLAELRDIA